MKVITKNNYQEISQYSLEGLLVCVPKKPLYANAEFYIYGVQVNTDNEYEIPMISYNKEDGCINGFSANILNVDELELIFKDFDAYDFYLFDDLTDFCNWYLHKDDKLHESIDKFIKDTDKFYTKTKPTRREKYKDIIELFKYQHELSNLENQLCEAEITNNISKIEDCKMLLEIGKENFSRWLDSEVE